MSLFPAKYFRYCATALAFAVFGIFIYKFHDDIKALREINQWQFSQLLILSLLTILLNGAKLRSVALSFAIHLQFKEWLGLSSILLTLNGLLFKSGTLVTSNYLKRVHHLPYMSYVGSLGADFLVTLLGSALVGLAVSSYLAVATDIDCRFLIIGFALLNLFLFLLMSNSFHIKKSENRIFDALTRAIKALNDLLGNKQLLTVLCFIAIGIIIVTTLRFYVSSSVLHFKIPLTHCFLFTVVAIIIRNVPMVQSDVGTRELVVGLLSQFLGSGLKEGFLVTAVDRIFVLFWCLALAILYRNILSPQDKSAT